MLDTDKEPDDPKGPLWYTFTFLLPYTLGLTDETTHYIVFDPKAYSADGSSVWRDANAESEFGHIPAVRIKFFRQPMPGFDISPTNADTVLKAMYGKSLMPEGKSWPLYGTDGTAYEQWVSLETPGSRLVWESDEDRAYAFHRSLTALNEFIASYILAFGQTSVQPLVTQDIGPLVFRGAYDKDKKWHNLGPLMMHPDTLPTSIPTKNMSVDGKRLKGAVATVAHRHPYLPAKMWYWRSHAATRRGDQIDIAVSLQTSMESMLYATWQMILIDQHTSSVQIETELNSDTPYKSLLTKVLPPLLGGRWDLTASGTPVGSYWKQLYQLRNRIVHAGHRPTIAEGNDALTAYKNMRTFINDRVWAKRRTYPRTMLARIGTPELFGYKDPSWLRKLHEQIDPEGYTWWLPYDIAGRT